MRLDQYLVQHRLSLSRTRAQESIAAGLVHVNGVPATKPAHKVGEADEVVLTGATHPFVSRGGVKLEAALCAFDVDPAGKVCLDLGASTGGFTDVLLRNAAEKVYAVDVGTGQLHEHISSDTRVINLERTHAKDLSSSFITDPVDLIVCDVSFISLKKALPPALALAAPQAKLVALIKPQFEVGPSGIGKGGLVKDGLAEPAARNIVEWIARQDWIVTGVIDSPIKGGDGNAEFLVSAVNRQ
ncbi:TlyA family RNA methyltransferase [Hyphococcus flavus]|uniref:TlyA family RNA methyltransferase n=1 Tax=Hyphococcus flavus TaxID=1866326 RepID=A0AAF0CEX7_9PROT|nr:TlyA family RNA methyltransferase [Hyphococcus flavus]WDI30208.1 TlyA family RNA methyltransferase [Hyphococcus flavus]